MTFLHFISFLYKIGHKTLTDNMRENKYFLLIKKARKALTFLALNEVFRQSEREDEGAF